MTATGHAIIGVSLAALLPNPFIGIPIAVVSHIACDLFPHWDSGTARRMGRKKSDERFFIEAVIDVLISGLVTLFLVSHVLTNVNLIYGFTMAFSAQFFDYLSMSYTILHIKLAPFKTVYKWQRAWNVTLDAPWGIINQAAICVLFIVLAKIY